MSKAINGELTIMKSDKTSSDRAELERLYRRNTAPSDLEDDDHASYDEEEFAERAKQARRRRTSGSPLNSKSRQHDYYQKAKPSTTSLLTLCALSLVVNVITIKAPEFLGSLVPIPAQVTTPNPLPTTPVVADVSNSFNRIPGLSASKSTITGFADAESMTAAYYWTMTLTNSGNASQEARMRINLPTGATISRATLWVNGVAQEAAFSTTSQVTTAYNWVRNGRQEQFLGVFHDPLIITQESPGHILVKAAPVTAGGAEMKIRIGFTAPLKISGQGTTELELPHVEESNFNISSLQDVHIESSSPVSSNDTAVLGQAEQKRFMLRGNIRPEELGSLKIDVQRPVGAKTFAVRATHSPIGTYIVVNLRPDSSGGSSLTLEKTRHKPNCQILQSEPAAHRLSTLWAYAQVESLAAKGDTNQANQLAHVHRVVSSISGATVLELEGDYSRTGLSRDLYATSAFTGDSIAAGGGAQLSAPNSRLARGGQSAPILQGATNGYIGPQGSDATVITGVNTAGTVRVSNLANLEALVNLFASGVQLCLGTVGVAMLLHAFIFRTSILIGKAREIGPAKLVMIGTLLVSLAACAQGASYWLVATARDMNLFA